MAVDGEEEGDVALAVDKQWRLSKQISVITLGALAAQAVVLIWIASSAYAELKSDGTARDRRLERIERVNVEERLVRLETQAENTKDALDRIEGKLDLIATKLMVK